MIRRGLIQNRTNGLGYQRGRCSNLNFFVSLNCHSGERRTSDTARQGCAFWNTSTIARLTEAAGLGGRIPIGIILAPPRRHRTKMRQTPWLQPKRNLQGLLIVSSDQSPHNVPLLYGARHKLHVRKTRKPPSLQSRSASIS